MSATAGLPSTTPLSINGDSGGCGIWTTATAVDGPTCGELATPPGAGMPVICGSVGAILCLPAAVLLTPALDGWLLVAIWVPAGGWNGSRGLDESGAPSSSSWVGSWR